MPRNMLSEPPAVKSNDPAFQWTKDQHGADVMPSAPAAFLEWLLSFPRDPATQEEYAKQHDLAPRTLRRWKADPRFRKEWEARSNDLNLSIERVQSVIDNLHKIASERADAAGVKAAMAYLEFVDRYTPRKRIVVEDDRIETMTQEELLAIAQGID